jgi:Subtilase family
VIRRVLLSLIVILAFTAAPVRASGGLIVRVAGGLLNIQLACLLTGCTVVENIDGQTGELYLVAAPTGIDLNTLLTLLLNITGVIDVEVDAIAHVGDSNSGTQIPAALYDTSPTPYYGATVPHGYVAQPAVSIIRLPAAQAAYPSATGGGVVAIIDTGVDPNHPVLRPWLLPGYDFTRNQRGADETLDVTLAAPPIVTGVPPTWVGGDGSGNTSQSTAAVVNQSTAAVVNGNPGYADFGHGTMVAGLVHLVAPTAKILPLKAFHADGTGYNSDILRAIYMAIANHANVLNMSFTMASYSGEVAAALDLATLTGTVSVASAGNSGQETMVYPAGLWNVMGIASTNNNDQLSSFSNYGPQLVWVAAPGEGVVTTYPFSTWAAGWGTSFSAPLISGLAADFWGMNWFSDQNSAGDSVGHADPIDLNAGHGLLDTFQAMQFWSQSTGGN